MIPLFKVAMSPEAGARVAETLASGYVGEGAKVQDFEAALGRALGLEPAPLAVNSCTAAIDLALHLIGVGPGDEVISTPMTCTATNGPIVNRGAKIVWADVDPLTGLIDPRDVARLVMPWTKAIVAVDWGGRSCDYWALRQAAPRLPIIEDAAHRLALHPTSQGDYVCWSFGPIKHLTCGGYGGALLVPEDQRERARLLRWHGLDRTSKADFRCEQSIAEAGYRYHLTDDLATVGLANLPLARANVERARANARWYDRVLRDVRGVRIVPIDDTCTPWLYTVLVEDRDAFIIFAAEHGVATSQVHARNDVHPAYAFPSGPLPGVDHFASHQVAIPTGWWLSEQDREHVARVVIDWANRANAIVLSPDAWRGVSLTTEREVAHA